MELLCPTFPPTVRRSWATTQKRMFKLQQNDNSNRYPHLHEALRQIEIEKDEEKQRSGVPKEQELSDLHNTEDPEVDEETENQIYEARLKESTDGRRLYSFDLLSLTDRDVLAFRKGHALIEKQKNKKPKRKKNRKK